MFLYKPKYTEDYRTILDYILKMPEVTRHEFYKSVEGQNIVKGIQLQAENDKSPKDSSGATRKWDDEELDKVIKDLHNASPEQREAILQLLPGPVIATLLARTKPIEGEGDKKIVKGIGTGLPGSGVRGPQKGTAGYEQWKEKLRATRAAKRKTPLPTGRGKEGPSQKEFSREKKMGSHKPVSKEGKRPDGYKHFVRQIGEHGEIHDNPSDRKKG